MKLDRQGVIMDIIKTQNIETQNQLMEALAQRGIKSTQATLSRDIRDLHLVKVALPGGVSRYAVAASKENGDISLRLKTILKESIVSYYIAQNLLVIKTLPGLAPAACSALDNMGPASLVGTIAGDDTALLVMKDNASAITLYHEIEEII